MHTCFLSVVVGVLRGERPTQAVGASWSAILYPHRATPSHAHTAPSLAHVSNGPTSSSAVTVMFSNHPGVGSTSCSGWAVTVTARDSPHHSAAATTAPGPWQRRGDAIAEAVARCEVHGVCASSRLPCVAHDRAACNPADATRAGVELTSKEKSATAVVHHTPETRPADHDHSRIERRVFGDSGTRIGCPLVRPPSSRSRLGPPALPYEYCAWRTPFFFGDFFHSVTHQLSGGGFLRSRACNLPRAYDCGLRV